MHVELALVQCGRRGSRQTLRAARVVQQAGLGEADDIDLTRVGLFYRRDLGRVSRRRGSSGSDGSGGDECNTYG